MWIVPSGQEITQNNQVRKGHTGQEKGEQTRINSGRFASVNPTDTSGCGVSRNGFYWQLFGDFDNGGTS